MEGYICQAARLREREVPSRAQVNPSQATCLRNPIVNLSYSRRPHVALALMSCMNCWNEFSGISGTCLSFNGYLEYPCRMSPLPRWFVCTPPLLHVQLIVHRLTRFPAIIASMSCALHSRRRLRNTSARMDDDDYIYCHAGQKLAEVRISKLHLKDRQTIVYKCFRKTSVY